LRDLTSREFRRILIIKPSSFGDVIHALPVLNGLRQRFPKARISWLVANSCAGLLEGHPALDEIIRFDRRRYGHVGRSFQVSIEFMEFVNALRARAFDLVVDLQGLFRSGFLALASGARTRIGFALAREFAWMFYSDRVAVPDPQMHAVDRNYLFARHLGFADVPISFELSVQPEGRAHAQRLLAEGGIAPGAPYLLIAPGTRWETKLWPAEHFAELARALEGETGLPLVLIGMESESEIARQVEELAGGRILNLAGRTGLPEVMALVAGASMSVMHDSGPMHLATAFDKPMVAIYGPTSPQLTGPYRRPEAVVRCETSCSPCRLKRVASCEYNHRCLRELSPQVVLQRVLQAMKTGVS
jgi:heptosyltransferase I